MEAIKTNYEYVKINTDSIKNNKNEYKNKINDTLSSTKITKELAELFWLNKEKQKKITQYETKQLANSNEINNNEAQLSKIFWKHKEMMKLNKKPLSLSSVMDNLEDYTNNYE